MCVEKKGIEVSIDKLIVKLNQACEVFDYTSNLNFPKSDFFIYSLISKFSDRNYNFMLSVIKSFEHEYREKKDNKLFSNNKYVNDRITIYYLKRDIIENIEILFYMLLNKCKYVNDKLEFTNEYDQRMRMLLGKIKTKGYRIYNDKNKNLSKLEEELYKKFNEKVLENDFIRIKNIKEDCNNVIHKNGFHNIFPIKNHYNNYMIDHFDDLLFICKFNFKLLFLLQGHFIASTDYIDSLEMGITPQAESQYWVASVFVDYMKIQFSKIEKEWLLKHNYYCMSLEDIFKVEQ